MQARANSNAEPGRGEGKHSNRRSLKMQTSICYYKYNGLVKEKKEQRNWSNFNLNTHLTRKTQLYMLYIKETNSLKLHQLINMQYSEFTINSKKTETIPTD